MDPSGPNASIPETQSSGIWPVISHATNYYRPYLPPITTALTAAPSSRSPLWILDIGASFGDSLAHFATILHQQIDRPTTTVALDVNRTVLRGARQRQTAETLIWGYAQALPFTRNTFDIVLSHKLAAFLPPAHQSQMLREIDRVLNPTGHTGIELDPQGTPKLNTTSRWVIPGTTLSAIRDATDDFEQYPLPLSSTSKAIRVSSTPTE